MRLALATLLVRDYDEAIDWFSRALSFALVENTFLSRDKRWVVMAPPDGGASILLARAVGDEQRAQVGRQAGGRVAFFLSVDDFDGRRRSMEAQGVRFSEPTRHEPYGKVAVFEDLYGNRWDLIELRRPAA